MFRLLLVILLVVLGCTSRVCAQTTTFVYQGKLSDAGVPAEGSYLMQFKLFDALASGTQIGSTLSDLPVTASGGIITVTLDFGAPALSGANRWLEIAVKKTAGEMYSVLSPREQITSSPYAIRSLSAATADVALDAQKLGGASAAQFVQTNDSRLSDARNPLPGSANYVQNTTSQQAASFNVSGSGTVGSLNVNGATTIAGISAPAAASAGQARLFFNSATNKLRISENGGGYVDLVGAGGVSGSGTVNRIPFWSAGTTLADSVISQSGTSIGIGTTVPTAQLTVVGGGGLNNVRITDNNTLATALDLSNTSTGGHPWRLQSVGSGVASRVGNLEIWEASTAPNPAIAIQPNGNVGIGTDSPSNTLDVNGFFRAFNTAGGNVVSETGGDTNSWAKFWVKTPVQQWSIGSSTNFNDNQLYFSNESGGGIQMVIMPNGNVGIGTTNPTKAKLEVHGFGNAGSLGACSTLSVTGVTSFQGCSNSVVSVYAEYDMVARSFWAFSDKRVKRIEGRSDATRDLATLAGIEITDYTYIDTIARGTGKRKKVIAQQVEKVYPQAVSRTTDVVPDIYRKAEVRDGWISLATNLKKGERVRLIGMKKDSIHEVLEVAPGRFRIDFTPDSDQVFVYGREVKDFRNVDYEAIAMLNVSATQELNRRLEKQAHDLVAQAAEIAALQQQLTRMAQLADEQASLLAQAVGWANRRGDIRSGRADAIARVQTSAPPDHPSYP